ncbi:uncharacterized protein [Procambarus clarkii]|uniref:uncharacterized protein isoform X2 n=1 Tax=Procambarus clarkii TaxID=6728 RepID=UPI00374445ED
MTMNQSTQGSQGLFTSLLKKLRGARLITTSCVSHKIITSHFPSPKPSSTNLTSQILKDSSKWANQIATECGVTRRRYSFSQLVDRVARWAGMLTKLGIKKGDFVAIIMLNCPEYPIVMLGAISIGAIVTGVNPTYTPGEILRQLEDSGAKLVIGDTFSEKKIDAALAEYKKPTVLVINGPSTVDGALDLLHILEDLSLPFADPVEVSGKDLALMPYSSGTTGKPKGVALSHSAVASNVTMLVHPSVFTSHETTDSYQDSFLCYLPYFHVYGIVPMMMTGLQMGVKLVSTPKFDPNNFVKDIRQHKVGTLHLVPPVLNFLNQSPTVTPEALASLHTTLCGAAPVLVTDVQAFKERIKKPLFFQEAYGLTEALITHVTMKSRERIGRCGHLLPGVSAKVVDTLSGQTLPPDHNGEICIKTPAMMTGYYRKPDATSATIDSEGWLHSGDIGSCDEEGSFAIVDRIKDLIKVKALQVSPSELEEVVLQHPKVVEVSVVGVPDSRIGEAPRAYVVTSAPTTQDEITKFVDSKVAPYKRLVGGVVFVREIPKTATGKVLRRELKKMALGTTSAAMT